MGIIFGCTRGREISIKVNADRIQGTVAFPIKGPSFLLVKTDNAVSRFSPEAITVND